MRGAADEIDRTFAQCRVAFVDGIDELQRHIEAFALEHAKLDRRNCREIRRRDHVRHGKLHALFSFFSSSRSTGVFMATSPRRALARSRPSSKYSLRTAICACRSRSSGQWPSSYPCHGGCGVSGGSPSRSQIVRAFSMNSRLGNATGANGVLSVALMRTAAV